MESNARLCSARGCDSSAAYKSSDHSSYCARHMRYLQMRRDAKRRGKAGPANDELDVMVASVTASGRMSCPVCASDMEWKPCGGRSRQVSIQHDRSGCVRLLCHGCNSRHASMPESLFYSIAAHQKWCATCDSVQQRTDFYVDRSKASGLTAKCKRCSYIAHRDFIAKRRSQHEVAHGR